MSFDWLNKETDLNKKLVSETAFKGFDNPKNKKFTKLFNMKITERVNEKVIFSHAKMKGSSKFPLLNLRLHPELKERIEHLTDCSANTFFQIAAEYMLDNLEKGDISLTVFNEEENKVN
jgi:hypothetical protein